MDRAVRAADAAYHGEVRKIAAEQRHGWLSEREYVEKAQREPTPRVHVSLRPSLGSSRGSLIRATR